MRKYGESKTTRIMMATLPHVTSGLGLRKFQADGFLLTRVYLVTRRVTHIEVPYYYGNLIFINLQETPPDLSSEILKCTNFPPVFILILSFRLYVSLPCILSRDFSIHIYTHLCFSSIAPHSLCALILD